MSKISWLDSVNMQSGIHITDGSNQTLCGYDFQEKFDAGIWKPFKVGNHKTHKCQTCIQKAKEANISIKIWDDRVPQRDFTLFKRY